MMSPISRNEMYNEVVWSMNSEEKTEHKITKKEEKEKGNRRYISVSYILYYINPHNQIRKYFPIGMKGEMLTTFLCSSISIRWLQQTER